MLETLVPIFDAYNLAIETMMKVAKPIAKIKVADMYPQRATIVQEAGPEIIHLGKHDLVIENSRRLIPLPKGEKIFPQSQVLPLTRDNKIPTEPIK